MKKYCILLMIIFISACAKTPTKYEPMLGNQSTGYTERQIAEGSYEIQVRGNVVTTYPTLEDYFHRRASELCGSTQYSSDITEETNLVIRDGVLTSYLFIPTSMAQLPHITGTVQCEVDG